MRLDANKLSSAVRLALSLGVVTAAGTMGTAYAQDAGNNSDQKSQSLETIVVTGSNIRRVDIETANPVVTIDRAAIQASGKPTLGDLIQDLPGIAGNANNPRVNNGGGDGQSNISLRGLGSQRTLVLVDGRRTIAGGITTDVNAIPAALVERIEVLTDGAGAVYGSDAIGGVVNVILRHNYQGAELSTEYGESDRDDGRRKNFSLMFGQSTDKGSLIGGIDYNKSDQILAGNRDYSKFSYQLKNGLVSFTGSVASPGGFISAPQFANCPPIAEAGGGPGGTFDASAPGGNGIPPGYRCFKEGSATSLGDLYNFAAINLIATPTERTNAFLLGDYKLTDSVDAYMTILHNKTDSRAQLAPLPVDLAASNLTLTAGNPYNPFGVDLGASTGGVNDDAIRATALGPRILAFQTTNDQVVAGLKGGLLDTSWQWDANLNFGHFSQQRQHLNYFNGAALNTALGNNCVLPVAGVPLSPNTCVDILNQNDPNTIALLHQFYSLNLYYHTLDISKEANISANGDLFSLPAGNVSAAVGATYRKFHTESDADALTHADPTNSGKCGTVASSCTSPFSGGYDIKEVYAEVLVPIVKDAPFAHSLNLILGDRYTDGSTFGTTNNWKAALEYRPIEDLLLRGNATKVFRAPNTTESFAALASSFDAYVSPGAGFGSKNGNQVQVLFSGAAVAGLPLSPEQGSSFDYGFVYDPHWIPGLTVSADAWRIYLNDLIVRPDGQTIANFCFANSASPYCKFIVFANGKIDHMTGVGYVNLGRLDTNGVDLSASYRLPETEFGNFKFNVNATYVGTYDNTVPGAPITHAVGQYTSLFGNIPRVRGLGSVDWNMGPMSATWTTRYVGGLTVPTLNHLYIGGYTEHNLAIGYNIEPINTRIDLGIDNVFDKQPSLLYQAVVNANVDVFTYDPIGRYYFARATIKF